MHSTIRPPSVEAKESMNIVDMYDSAVRICRDNRMRRYILRDINLDLRATPHILHSSSVTALLPGFTRRCIPRNSVAQYQNVPTALMTSPTMFQGEYTKS